jgi:hypothetical protein
MEKDLSYANPNISTEHPEDKYASSQSHIEYASNPTADGDALAVDEVAYYENISITV